MTRTTLARLFSMIICLMAMASPVLSYDLQSAAEDMDNYVIPAFPPAYGEIIDRLPETTVGDIPKVLKALEIFGYLKTMGDVAQKLDAGDNTGAALDAATGVAGLAINLLKDEATKKVIVAGVGISTIPISALMATIDITRKSFEAVQASKTALDLERLYYTIQSDPVLKVKGRKLGEGDPIKIDATTIEYLWRKVLFDEKWRDLFKNYVTSELSQEWPEPTLWEQWTMASDHLAEAKLLEERTRLKAHIAGLLKELSKVAQKEEARVLLSQQLRELEAIAGKLSPGELESALKAYFQAIKELPGIEAYVTGLPGLISGYRTRISKASATELVKIREVEIIYELAGTSARARTIRFLPPLGRYGAKRQSLLTALKNGYSELAGLRNEAGRSQVNTKLIEESKKLAVSGNEFTFTRYVCSKVFDDVKSGFDQKVVAGAADAGAAVDKAKGEIVKQLEQLSSDYSKDSTKNLQKYQEKLTELSDQRNRLIDQRARTSDPRQRDDLYYAIERLGSQIATLNSHYESYAQLYSINSGVDINSCKGALQEIDTFVQENSNRQGIVMGSMEEAFNDAMSKKWAFYLQHQSPHRQILAIQDLEQYSATIRDNPDSYAGLSFEFLKKHLVNEKDVPRSQNIRKTLEGMTNAIRTYHDSLYLYRMPYYADWEKSAVPSLRYMESPAARDAIAVIMAAIDTAISTLTTTKAEDYPETYREKYTTMLGTLRNERTYMEEQSKRLARASGMAAGFAAYCDKALRNNSQIAEDAAAVVPVMRSFYLANSSISTAITMFMIESKDKPSKMLSSSVLFKILEDTGALERSKRLELGIEELVKEPFLEMRGKNGLVDILPEHFKNAIAAVQAAPVNEYGPFFKHLYAVADNADGTGIVMELLLKSGNTFTGIFQDVPKLGEDAVRLNRLFIERRNEAEKNQNVINERNARFEIVLGKVNQFISLVQAKYDAGDFHTAAGYESFLGDVRYDYEKLGAKRQDIDDAFTRLNRLIEDAKRKSSTTSAEASQAVSDLYARFKEAYEARDDSRIMSFIADEWQAGDGTTLADLQTNLSRSFRIFDDIKYELTNLRSIKLGNIFNVNYDVTITSRIYRRNIKHVEKSQVNEEVSFDGQGKPKINRTLNGRFWYVE